MQSSVPERKPRAFPWIVLVLGLAYTLLQLSPSSYAIVFDRLHVSEDGLIAGTPRGIRSDEWNIHTPLIQVAVNNGHERFNRTSIYGEDLRSAYPLPLWDWGLPFKPSFWLILLDPASGYSFHHAYHMVLFLVGFHLLFRKLGIESSAAAGGSVLLFFTSYVQFWWMHLGLALGYVPWLALIMSSRWRPGLRFPALLAAFSCMMFTTQLYPPFWVTSGALALLLATCADRAASRPANIALVVTAAAFCTALVGLYQLDTIQAMLGMPELGGRRAPGGGVPWSVGMSLLLPSFTLEGFEPVGDFHNVCEASTVGSFLPLLTLVFADWSRLRTRQADAPDLRAPSLLLLSAAALSLAWIHFPARVPWFLGSPLLWHQTFPQRLNFVPGIALSTLCLLWLSRVGVRWHAARFGLMAALCLVGWWIGKGKVFLRDPVDNLADLVLLPPLLGALLLALRRGARKASASLLVWTAALANVALFAGFNPVQRSGPIFERPTAGLVPLLAELQSRHPKQRLVVSGDWGAALNGYGFRSISAVLLSPPRGSARETLVDDVLSRWPGSSALMETYFRVAIFDRWPIGHEPVTGPEKSPRFLNVLAVPLTGRIPSPEFGVKKSDASRPAAGGYLDRVALSEDRRSVHLEGWRYADTLSPSQRVSIVAGFPCRLEKVVTVDRPDIALLFGDASFWFSGFAFDLVADRPIEASELASLRILSDDPQRGPRAVDTSILLPP